jgi:GAF domain-containing protein
MIQRSGILILSWILGLVTLAVLLVNVPDTGQLDVTLWVLFAVLVGLMLNLGTRLDEIVVSPAPTAVLMTYLTIGEGDAAPAALWSVAIGALVGNLVWLSRALPVRHSRLEYWQMFRSISISTAQLTLGLYISGWAYQLFGGRLPLEQLDSSDILPLSGFLSIFLSVYLSVLLLEAHLYRRRTPRMVAQYWQGLVGNILLPVPFAVVGAVAYHELSRLAFGILIAGLLIIVAGVHLISQAQARSREQVLELSALSAISQAMRTNLDLDALLDVVYQQVSRLLNISNFTVVMFDPSRNALFYPLNINNHQRVPLAPHEAGQGLSEYVIHEKNGLLLADDVRRRAQALGLTPPSDLVYSWMGVPLLAPDRVLGCMVVYSNRSDQNFSPKDLQQLTTIAGQTGIAADNAQLYGQARDRAVQLATLNNITTILSGTLDVRQILDLVGSSSVAVANCNAVALYMWWEDAHRPLSLACHNGLSEAFVADPPQPLLLDLDDLQRRRQPVIVTDLHIDHRTHNVRALMDREHKRAWIEFLLRKGDELLGILVFLYDEPRNFGPEEIELLRTFTNQAALAISNARLYTQTDEALDRRVEQLSALADIGQELTSTLNLQRVFQLVLDRALEATQSSSGLLLLRR